jgi:diguanylate cyclase (GGDEF)-like protein
MIARDGDPITARAVSELNARLIAYLTPSLVVLFVVAGVIFAFDPSARASALAMFLGAGAVLVSWRLSTRSALAAFVVPIAFLVIVLAEPIVTGNLSTNAFFLGVAALVGAMWIGWHLRWAVLAIAPFAALLLVFSTSPQDTPGLSRTDIGVNGIFLTMACLVVPWVFLRAYTYLLDQAGLAHRAALRRSAEISEINDGLTAAVERREAELAEAIEHNASLVRRLEALVRIDPLTGLANRAFLEEWVEGPGATASAVAMLDVDHFKAINDGLSYSTGDLVLQELGRVLREQARSEDVVVRYGGEEFLFAIRSADADSARQAVERLREAIAEWPWDFLSPGLRVTVSAGLAVQPSDPVVPIERLISAADQAVRVAKASGRDRLHMVTVPAD